jgi:hypothetical protein
MMYSTGQKREMETTDIVEEITSLPPEAQRQVMDFVAFLQARSIP